MENDIFFWKLIEQSKIYDTRQKKCEFLIQQLSERSKNATVYFEYYMRQKMKGLFKADFLNLLKFMYVMPVGEDFVKFAGWTLSQGKDFYEQIKINPDTFAEKITPETSIFDFSFEDFTEIANEAYRLELGDLAHEKFHTYINPSDFGELMFSYRALPFHEVEDEILDDETELKKQYPKTSKALTKLKIEV